MMESLISGPEVFSSALVQHYHLKFLVFQQLPLKMSATLQK